ncbi:MBL fold metallo-hydrolase [Halobacteriovorax sp. HLS]|uniref:MBL fold metallo-hydrolase n=1 Tax=Halobacteriovorax sp. HLS TaxID=2234000 RepID=UPI0019D45662|nr:MBL fold metallo-hydrolase [Halobacteriovorax sp. HLS]
MALNVREFFDKNTFTMTYIVYDKETKDSIIIDPVLDFDNASGRFSYESVNTLIDYIQKNKLTPLAILETHAHADHITSATHLKNIFKGIPIGISSEIVKVQDVFNRVFNDESSENDFDLLLSDNQIIKFGAIEVKIIHTPGHTPACSSFLIGNKVFTGDALFMPDFGTGRCDFPSGSSSDLYHSVHEKLYTLADETEIFTGHDYMPGGRELQFKTTIGKSKKENIHIKEQTTCDEFVSYRDERDKTLAAPKLLLPSIQVNIKAGKLPQADKNGKSYLKLPITI